MARTLASREESDSYFAPGFARPHLTQKQSAFIDWYRAFFDGIREPPTTSCGPVEVIEADGVRLGVMTMNSALFSQGDDDHARLWIGRRALEPAANELKSLNADLRITLIHHPLSWLADLERANVRTKLTDAADILLRGHLHESDVGQAVYPQGSLIELSAGAAYQTRHLPNRALYVTFDESELAVYPIRYEDSPEEVWTLDPSVFPHEPEHVGRFSLQRAGEGERREGVLTPPRPAVTAEALIDGLQLGDHEKAALRAYGLLRASRRELQLAVVGDLARFLREASADGDEIYRASSVLEAINRLDPSLVSQDVIEELAGAEDTSKRMSAAMLLWDRAEVAPGDVPLGVLGRLARPATEDGREWAPAVRGPADRGLPPRNGRTEIGQLVVQSHSARFAARLVQRAASSTRVMP